MTQIVKIRQDKREDPIPDVFSVWNLDLRCDGEFPIRDFILDSMDWEDAADFADAIESGEIDESIIDYLADDLNDTIWHEIKKHLTFEINTVELRTWIRYVEEKENKNG